MGERKEFFFLVNKRLIWFLLWHVWYFRVGLDFFCYKILSTFISWHSTIRIFCHTFVVANPSTGENNGFSDFVLLLQCDLLPRHSRSFPYSPINAFIKISWPIFFRARSRSKVPENSEFGHASRFLVGSPPFAGSDFRRNIFSVSIINRINWTHVEWPNFLVPAFSWFAQHSASRSLWMAQITHLLAVSISEFSNASCLPILSDWKEKPEQLRPGIILRCMPCAFVYPLNWPLFYYWCRCIDNSEERYSKRVPLLFLARKSLFFKRVQSILFAVPSHWSRTINA